MEPFLYVQRMRLVTEYERACVCVCASMFYAIIHVIDRDIQICISNKIYVLSRGILQMVSWKEGRYKLNPFSIITETAQEGIVTEKQNCKERILEESREGSEIR
jgi:hypothetical protein